MEKVISLSKTSYDPFIDYLKAYSILCVVLSHALPVKLWDYTMIMIWGNMQVPMFVLIQTFHAYKKGLKPQVSTRNLCKRIICPFILIQLFILLCCFGIHVISGTFPIRNELIQTLLGGGKGPGSYYPWVYVQLALILPFAWKYFQRYKMSQLLLPYVFVCVGFDILFSFIDMLEWLYRLTAVRYIFLIYLGMIWVKDGVRVNWKTVIFSLMTIGVTLFFYYTKLDLEPWFFNTGWTTHRWICYYYVGSLLTVAVWYLYRWIQRVGWIDKLVIEVAKSSYEIFLVQMAVFVLLPPIIGHFIDDVFIRFVVSFTLEIFLSVWIGIEFRNMVMTKIFKKSK